MTTSTELRRIYKASILNPISADRVDRYDPGYLVVSGGRIDTLTRHDPRPEAGPAEFLDFVDATIVPGFIDTHVHLPQFGIIGIGAGELLSWLNNFTYPEEERFIDSNYAAAISKEFFDALIANGTTTAVIYSSVHEEATDIAFEAASAKGIRAFIGKVMMDRNVPASLQEKTEDSIAASIRLFEKWDGAAGGRLRYVFTPRFAASCSMELMKRTAAAARERGAFMQSHLSENVDEVQWIRQLFPGSPSYAAVYEEAGLLADHAIMAHCIHLSSEEISLLAGRRTNVAFCPYSNRTLHSGIMPYRILRNTGLNISLGTDVAGGPSLSMLDQMDEAMKAAAISDSEALYLATLAGARALGLADKVGSFEAGKEADFVVLKNRSVREVYVRGKLVYF
jgi:guanine deaminase